jgi:hypothetical protein
VAARRSAERRYAREKVQINGGKKEHHLRRRAEVLALLGGRCLRCGYDEFDEALECHHRDPSKKEGDITRLLRRVGDAYRREIEKCVLLCANCHRALHRGRWALPQEDVAATEAAVPTEYPERPVRLRLLLEDDGEEAS